MSSNATLTACPAPFLQEDLYPLSGGFVAGRFCSDSLGPSCCLPCPQTEWFYPDNFDAITKSADWVNVVGMACSLFLIASFAFLPTAKTHRHYLSVCLAIATVMMQLGFIIPLGAQPNQCYNAITPNDMNTSKTSAGWGIPAIALTIALVFSGVSFRFGDTCHINHTNSLADFWIPLLVFAGVTVIIQFTTFGYCIKVYLASLVDDSTTTNSSGALPSYTNSIRGTISPRQAYRRVRRVIELQWRGIAIVLLIIADVVFFAVVFVFMDDVETNIQKNPEKLLSWLQCLIETKGSKSSCAKYADSLVVNEATVMSVLMLLSMNGIWSLIFLGRWSMFSGWYEMVAGKVKPDNEFVSADVRAFKDPRAYEMLSRDRDNIEGKIPEPSQTLMLTPISPAVKSGRETPDYFGREARYKSPSRSFSAPKPPQGQQWDSNTSHAQPYLAGMDPLSMNKI
ncbi:hypothetical protein B7494_g1507 [Chlorociboria aeruginascens]|nr:hypothetical protein B7494_g1507 [Chlorociboria aeruginascens]